MATTFDSMPADWSFFKSAGVNPGERGGHHTKVQVICHRHRISVLGLGTADIPLQLFETCLDLPPGAVIFDDLLNTDFRMTLFANKALPRNYR
jgi:hypothetical protein